MPRHRRENIGSDTTPAEDKKRESGQGKEDEINRHVEVEYLTVFSGTGNDCSRGPLQGDGHDRRAHFSEDGADTFEEGPVSRHRVINAWRGEHALAQKTKRGDSDGARDHPGS